MKERKKVKRIKKGSSSSSNDEHSKDKKKKEIYMTNCNVKAVLLGVICSIVIVIFIVFVAMSSLEDEVRQCDITDFD